LLPDSWKVEDPGEIGWGITKSLLELAGTGDHTMKNKPRTKPEFLNELEDKQRNILWHDTSRNDVTLNRFMWNGSPRATVIQRVGLVIFSLLFIGIGLTIVQATTSEIDGMTSLLVLSLTCFFLGWRFLRNAFLR
jgi:hypothetical protein